MINILDGGEEETVKRRWIIGAGDVAASTELFGAAKYDLPRDGEDGAIASAFEHFMRVHGPWLEQMYVPTGNETMYMSMGNMMGGYPGFGLFMLTMLGQTSDEQKSWWMEAAYSMQMTGAYAQTELGHGSNVRGLQTTATYDAGTEEWILDTPTLAAMKWWPSNLVMATHCVLYAQMIIDGVEQGVHVFMLQLRDENLEQLSGVEVGDIGTKVGDNNVDIGYLRLNEVRIPRRHLMEKRQHVEADGTYVKHGNPNASAASQRGHYLTMMSARIALVGGAAGALGRASTIAIRYSLVRRQGFKAADGAIDKGFRAEENQIIDYRMNQYTLLKNLAFAYAERFTSNWVQSQMDTLVSGDDDNGDTIMELHAVSAGLKGYCCNTTAVGIEELRKCCGGAGYLIASGIAALEADFKWRATAEGDTSVMLLQTARYLLAQADAAKQGLELAGLTVIFAPMGDDNFDPESLKPPAVTSAEDFFDLDFLLKLFEYRTVTAVYSLNKNLQKRLADGEAFEDAWGALTLKACKTGQSHILFFMLAKFIETARDDTLSDAGSPERTVLARLAALFALSDLQDGQQWAGLLSMDAMELAEDATGELMSAIRPDACTLVDSWDFPDRVLNSTIGGYDGNVYEAQYKAAAESPLNQTKMPRFIAKVEPFLDKEFLKLRNGLCVAAIEDADEWEYSDDEDDSDDDWSDVRTQAIPITMISRDISEGLLYVFRAMTTTTTTMVTKRRSCRAAGRMRARRAAAARTMPVISCIQ